MEYYSLDTAQHNQQKTWQITSISLAAVIALLSLELFYLLSKLSDLDIVHLGLGISQASSLLIFQVIIAVAAWKRLKTPLLGISIISLVFNIGYFIFYLLLELSSIFQIYQGNTSLQPAHPIWWYEIEKFFSISLVVQEILAIICCFVNLKFRSLIPDITEPELLSSHSRTEPVAVGLMTEAGTPKQDVSSKIIFVENSEPSDGFSSKLYTYAVAKEESYPEKSYGNHQATSYMQDASKIRSAKAKLDFDSVDMASLESR